MFEFSQAQGLPPLGFARYFNHRAKLASYRGPLLVLHADQDDLLDAAHARRLCSWGGGVDKRLMLFPSLPSTRSHPAPLYLLELP